MVKTIGVLGVGLLLVTACSNFSQHIIPPEDAISALRIGDRVRVTRNNGSVAPVKLDEINETEISGRLQTSVLGRTVTIPLSEIDEIKLYVKEDGIDADATSEALGWSWALVFWLVVL